LHLREYGLHLLGVTDERSGGQVCDWRFQLIGIDRENFVRGLQLLNPLNVSVEFDDLPRLVLNDPMLAVAREAWPEIEGQFAKIQPTELLDKLETVLGRVAFAPRSPEQQFVAEATFEQWCLANGLKVPGEQKSKYDEFRQKEIEERQRQEKALHDRFWGDNEY
jgi:hypothetical protein